MSDPEQIQGPTDKQRLGRSRRQLTSGQSRGTDSLAVSVTPPALEDTTTETGGPSGPEPTRFGDWERKGRCIDF